MANININIQYQDLLQQKIQELEKYNLELFAKFSRIFESICTEHDRSLDAEQRAQAADKFKYTIKKIDLVLKKQKFIYRLNNIRAEWLSVFAHDDANLGLVSENSLSLPKLAIFTSYKAQKMTAKIITRPNPELSTTAKLDFS